MIIENDTRDKNAVCYLFVANSIFFLAFSFNLRCRCVQFTLFEIYF